MFEYYTFGAPAQHSEPPSRDVSPHDTSFAFQGLPSPSPEPEDITFPGGISDLVSQFKGQDLFCDPFRSNSYKPRPERASKIFHTDLPPSPPPCRRTQRQQHMQLQCEQSHIRSITSLVEEMLAKESQCTIRRRTPSPTPRFDHSHLAAEDNCSESSDDMSSESSTTDSEHTVTMRRAAVPAGIRKYDGIRIQYRKSSSISAQNRPAVHSLPRMRKDAASRKRSN